METNNKNVVRLTESQLKAMVAESVRKALNEIGDTPFGQYMLGRTSERQRSYPNYDGVKAMNYAYNSGRGRFSDDYESGRKDQRELGQWIEEYGDYGEDSQLDQAKQEKDNITKNMHNLAYDSLPSYRKTVDDKERDRNAKIRHQMRKKYSLNNPMFNQTNESKLTSKIDKIVSESIDRILKNK